MNVEQNFASVIQATFPSAFPEPYLAVCPAVKCKACHRASAHQVNSPRYSGECA
jgi:hypothetical protein